MTKKTTKIAATTGTKAKKELAEPALAAQKVNRHWNDDNSLTVYVDGRKLWRLGGEENEDCSEDEQEDPEAYAEKRLNRLYKKAAGGWVWGRTTHGHNWHTKTAKIARLRAEATATALAAR